VPNPKRTLCYTSPHMESVYIIVAFIFYLFYVGHVLHNLSVVAVQNNLTMCGDYTSKIG